MIELKAITQCPYCKTQRKTGKGMYFHLIKAHGFDAPKAYDITYHSEIVQV